MSFTRAASGGSDGGVGQRAAELWVPAAARQAPLGLRVAPPLPFSLLALPAAYTDALRRWNRARTPPPPPPPPPQPPPPDRSKQ